MKSRRNQGTTSFKKIIFIVLVVLLGASGAFVYLTYFEGETPTISLSTEPQYLGSSNSISFSVTDQKRGIKQVRAELIQGEKTAVLLAEEYAQDLQNTMEKVSDRTYTLEFEPKKLGFDEGEVTLQISATDHSLKGFFKGNTSTASTSSILDTTAPKMSILHSEKYIQPGGAGIIIYRLSGDAVKHGLDLNGYFNPGFLVGDGREDVYICYFGLPYDAEDFSNAFLIAEDAAGNKKSMPVSSNFKASRFKKDTINVGDGFLNKKIPEFQDRYPNLQGDMLEQYLFANRTVRQKNNEKIRELCGSPHQERLWEGVFKRMAGSPKAGFADYRTYYYGGKEIDRQVHLGVDIASTKMAPIKAANHGLVVFADYMGIYGNMVVLDHGQGIYSLYSHLSQINVATGDKVEKDMELGRSGTSGMAGGDHLHFSMLVHGVFVTPKEWWDAQWIAVTIDEPLLDSKF